jgi:hypothetical protein
MSKNLARRREEKRREEKRREEKNNRNSFTGSPVSSTAPAFTCTIRRCLKFVVHSLN